MSIRIRSLVVLPLARALNRHLGLRCDNLPQYVEWKLGYDGEWQLHIAVCIDEETDCWVVAILPVTRGPHPDHLADRDGCC